MSGFQVNYNFNPNYNMWNNLTSQNRGKYINKQDSCWNNYGYNYSPYNYNNNMMYSYNRYMRTLTISSLINSTFEMLSDFVKSLGDMFKPAKTETKL